MNFKQYTLPNGLRLVVVPDEHAATVTALVLVGTGSLAESEHERGLSHFLEHMMFKGTSKRPSARILSEELDGLGAVSNAFTSHECTGYYVKGSPEHLPTFLDVLSDIYLNPLFPPDEIEKEKGVIIEEINMYEDMLPHKAGEILLASMFGDTPAGRSILGTIDSVRSYTRADFVRYARKHYVASNTVVVVAGNVDARRTKTLVAKAFAAVPAKPHKVRTKTRTPKSEERLVVMPKPSDQLHIAIGFHSIPFRHKDSAAAQLLSTILGRGMSSRLFLGLRETLGVAYYAHAEQESLRDYGVFGIAAGIDKKRSSEVFEFIARELRELRDTLVSEAELAKAKAYALGMIRLSLEASDDIAHSYGVPLVMGKEARTLAEVEREYRAVTTADIMRLARTLFRPDNVYMTAVGATQNTVPSIQTMF